MKAKGKLFYIYINNADTKYEDQWKVTLVCDAKEAKKLKAIGLKVRKTDELTNEAMANAGPYECRFNRYCVRRGKAAGKANPQPKQAILEDGVKKQFVGIVGNGSEGEVVFNPYEWGDKKGWSGDLVGIIVTKLVEYVPQDNPEGDLQKTEADSEFDDMEVADTPEDTPDVDDTDMDDDDDDDDDEF
jgi:hypothetical protein